MKHGLKKRILSLVLCISMVLPMTAVPMPVYSVENEESIAPLTNPFTPETIITLPDGTTTKSQSYRIPSMVTLADGTIVTAADIRWNTTYDGGGLDTLVAYSTDDGATWSYTLANYLGDNGNKYDPLSSSFIDASLTVDRDGQTIYMLCDLYAGGVALNGNGTQMLPYQDSGFTDEGHLKLSYNFSNYDEYLKDGKIYDKNGRELAGYTVDSYFNLYQNGTYVSNLFFYDSPVVVYPTAYLYLTKSTDGGKTWSEPTLLNLKSSSENACLVSPGDAITTKDGSVVFPVYSYSGSEASQKMGFIYSKDNGATWLRSTNFEGAETFSSEASVIELENGNLRFFYRNKNAVLTYVDYDMSNGISKGSWGDEVKTSVPVNSNTQLSAITYTKTSNGDQVVLVSCPTGPNGAGSDNNDGSMRTNGKIHVFTVNAAGEMTLKNTINVFDKMATSQLSGSNYTEEKGFFAYSSLTERADGSVALLYENNQFGWGASGSNGNGTYNPENVDTYYTITARTYDWFELLYGNVSEELKVAYEKLMDTDLIADFEAEYETLSASDIAELQESVMWDDIAVHKCLLVYDHFYSTVSEAGFNAVKEKYSQEYAYIQNDPELKYFNDLILEEVQYLDQHPEKRYVELGEIEYVELPSYTNVAPLAKPVVNTRLRSRATTGTFALTKNAVTAANDADNGIVLDKNVTKNDDGTYTVRLEAYTTGQTVTVVTEREKPVDIVLVLDLSSSMVSGRMDAVGYQIIQSTVAEQGYQLGADENLFVKIGDEYREVNVAGIGETTATSKQQYSGSKKAKDLYNHLQQGNKLYYQYDKNDPEKYVEVICDYSNYQYTFSYINPDTGTVELIAQTNKGSSNLNAYTFYTEVSVTTYESYQFSYQDANNQTVTKTYNPTDSIVGGDNPVYYTTYASGTISRAEALINALNSFTSQVAKKAAGKDGDITTTEDNVNHTIAIVGYNTAGSSTTGIYVGSTVNVWSNTNSITQAQYAAALQAMNTQAGVDNIEASIEKLKTSNASGTNTFAGVSMAHSILQANPQKDDPDRNQVVVIFTDGQPYGSQTINGTSYTPENAAIYHAKQIKDMGATVYTVGILDDGNATIPPSGKINIFMHGMSSNYKNATSTSNLGELTNDRYNVDGSNYYLLASNADDLNNIFTSISSSATSGGSITDLSTSTQIRDIISPYFQLPDDADLSKIELYSADYKGEDNWGDAVPLAGASPTISNDRKVIGVTGFDYKENWVGTATDAAGKVTYHGKKLIIEFPIVVDPDFLGGSGVATNGDTSGIYESEAATTPIEKFEVPDVDVALREISTVVQNKNVFLGNTVDLTSILNLYVKRNDLNENLQITVDGINNAYVNLMYTITLDNETVAVYTIPAGKTWADGVWTVKKGDLLQNYLASDDTNFTVTCVMSDAAESSELSPSTADGTATVFVYKPTVTFKDVTKTPMEDSVNYNDENLVSVVWLHGVTDSTAVTMEGEMPELTYTYEPDSECVDSNGLVITYNEFYVNVTKVLSKGKDGSGENIETDITNYVTYAHKDCPCGFDLNKGEFMIHLTQVFTSLVIQKAGWEAIDPNQSFIFNVVEVDANGNPIDNTTVTVTVHENGSVTIEGLLVNRSYMVTEDTVWSWRYAFSSWEYSSCGKFVAKDDENNAVVTLGAENNIITFDNDRSVIWWLDGDSWCNNIFKNPNE